MPLGQYQRKRDFGKTPEPKGGTAGGSGGRFVVQRHRATRLHYDFRLEIDGVLVSWAVPKGPTLDPRQRRLAMKVEDHPIEYLDFEGVIPRGQYGAGDVIVWDWGTWEPDPETPDPGRAITDGELKFRLDGQKLKGRFTIVRTRPRDGEDGEPWLLIKKRDEAAVDAWDAEGFPQSVKTGRTNDEVKANRDALWQSGAPAAQAEIDLSKAAPAPLPEFIEPMAATLASTAFDSPDWIFEIKWDGYRVEAIVDGDKVRLRTRHGNDAETYFPRLLTPPSWINAAQAIVDGEVVALDDQGLPDFGLLQLRISESVGSRAPGRLKGMARPATEAEADEARRAPLVYQAFDLLYADGKSLVNVPLEHRKRLLRSLLREHPRVRYAAHVERDGVAFFKAAQEKGLEGIIAKRRDSRYEPGRRVTTWLKLKVRPEQELVVGGYTPGEGNARDLGALILGVYEDGKLRYAGKVGSGFNARTRRELRERLDALATDEPPFEPPPPRTGELRGAHWARPELVIRAELGGWSRDGLVRQSAFKGIELDKDPREVTRERAIDSSATGAAKSASSARSKPSPDARPSAESEPPAKAQTSPASEGAPKMKPTSAPERKPPTEPAVSPEHPWTATEEELEALHRLGSEGLWSAGGHELKLTNLDKVLFPPPVGPDGSETSEPPVTKRELIEYFARIAPAMLPHLADRPLNLHRYPNGAGASGFWQKDIPSTAPKWLRIWHETGVEGREDREANDHLIADRVATLCWLGNQAAFEIHAWTSTIHDPWIPTFALIDIDPGEKTTWEETLTLARLFRAALGHLGVRGYPKVTGRRGIQIWIPVIRGRYTYEDTSRWVEQVSRAVGAMVPDLVSWEWSKSQRGGKARLDYTQNQPIKTLVAPYAVRPAAGAPVSAPITWEELDDPELRPNRWTIRTIVPRVAERGDLFAAAQTDHQELPPLA
ncbi:MAG: DNA ligase D [Chloroflexi bacterium]|nr:MAG: DNA ligase D [Chloroflexota bacterium]